MSPSGGAGASGGASSTSGVGTLVGAAEAEVVVVVQQVVQQDKASRPGGLRQQVPQTLISDRVVE